MIMWQASLFAYCHLRNLHSNLTGHRKIIINNTGGIALFINLTEKDSIA